MPYTYLIVNKITNQFYYGVRYANNCDPDELFKTYFTSSNRVKMLIEKYGIDSFTYQVRKTFDTEEQARIWECKVLRRMNAAVRSDCLNCHDSYGPPRMSGNTHPLYGIGHSDFSKKKMSNSHRGKKLSDETKKKMSLARIGKLNPMYGIGGMRGKKHSEETKRRMSISSTGRIHSIESIKAAALKNSQYKWWTNGKDNIRSKTSPGLEWKRGRTLDISGNKNPNYKGNRLG